MGEEGPSGVARGLAYGSPTCILQSRIALNANSFLALRLLAEARKGSPTDRPSRAYEKQNRLVSIGGPKGITNDRPPRTRAALDSGD